MRLVAVTAACAVLAGLAGAAWLASRPARSVGLSPSSPPVGSKAPDQPRSVSSLADPPPPGNPSHSRRADLEERMARRSGVTPEDFDAFLKNGSTTRPASGPAVAAETPAHQPAATEPSRNTSDDGGEMPLAAVPAPSTQEVGSGQPEEAASLNLDVPDARAPAPATAPSPPPVAATEPTTRPATHRPPLQPRLLPAEVLTDAQIERAVRRAGNYLIKQFNAQSLTMSRARVPMIESSYRRDNLIMGDPAGYAGMDALCVYALMQCGLALNEPELGPRGRLMGGMIEGMKGLPAGQGKLQTYARAVRLAALSTFNRPQDRAVIEEDLGCLIAGQLGGKYGYQSAAVTRRGTGRGAALDFQFLTLPGGYWDNSNSQYGLLGVWSAAEAGYEVPTGYWEECETHWTETQNDHNGMWGYRNAGVHPSPPMTAAGIASLFVVGNYRSAGAPPSVGRDPLSPALLHGMRWLQSGDNAVDTGGLYWAYSAYGIERIGLASGFKYFGRHDWYREIARRIVQWQQPDGGWTDTIEGGGSNRVATAYALLFLARARHPILMNKLGFDGYWANRPWDVANLARYASRQLERPLNWQVVPVNRPWSDWTDAPVLYLASHQRVPLGDKDFDNLRQFAEAGGLIFTHADGGADGEAFNDYVEKVLARKLFPRYEMQDVPTDHPVYRVAFPIKDRAAVPLRAVSNGSRLLLVHSPTDLGAAWQARDAKGHEAAFQLGVNLFVYAGGKRDLRNRLDPTYVPEPPTPPKNQRGPVVPALGTITVARVQYASDWDPEPYAWVRYARLFDWHTGYALEVTPVKWKDLSPLVTPFAHLTGRTLYEPTEEEVAALRSYVEGGGVLLADACGGSHAFDAAVRKALGRAFPDRSLEPIPWDHPLLKAGEPGMSDLSKPKVRLYTMETLGASPAKARLEMLRAGKGCVIVSKLDVVSGLLGTQTWGVLGYDRIYSENLMANAIFWALDGQPGK